jgi:hypothetical protein
VKEWKKLEGEAKGRGAPEQAYSPLSSSPGKRPAPAPAAAPAPAPAPAPARARADAPATPFVVFKSRFDRAVATSANVLYDRIMRSVANILGDSDKDIETKKNFVKSQMEKALKTSPEVVEFLVGQAITMRVPRGESCTQTGKKKVSLYILQEYKKLVLDKLEPNERRAQKENFRPLLDEWDTPGVLLEERESLAKALEIDPWQTQ